MERKHKYNATKTTVDGRVFDSKREAAVYQDLKQRQQDGEIAEIEFQPAFPLIVNGRAVARPYRADFRIVETMTQTTRIIDVKGYDEPYCKLRRKLAEAIHGVAIEIIK